MRVAVKRMTIAKYRELVEKLGPGAVFLEVPSTLGPAIKFKGVYTDQTKTEVAVSWPVDRPKEAQETFAKEVCLGGQPVEEMTREVERRGLSLIDGGN